MSQNTGCLEGNCAPVPNCQVGNRFPDWHNLPKPRWRDVLRALTGPAARMHRLAATCLYDEPYRPLDALAALIDGIGPAEAERAAALYDPEGVAILELYPA